MDYRVARKVGDSPPRLSRLMSYAAACARLDTLATGMRVLNYDVRTAGDAWVAEDSDGHFVMSAAVVEAE